jgi:hypothetical protein
MPTYLVEVYAPRGTPISDLVADARAVGGGMLHLRSIFVPEDELCLHLFSAAGFPSNAELGRFVEVVEEPPSPEFEPKERRS